MRDRHLGAAFVCIVGVAMTTACLWTARRSAGTNRVGRRASPGWGFPPRRTGAVSGRVLRADTGAPVQGAVVLGFGAAGELSATTDTDGRYAIAQLNAAACCLEVSCEDQWLASTVAGPFALSPDETTALPALRLSPGGCLVGRLEFPGGKPGRSRGRCSLTARSEASGALTPVSVHPDSAFRTPPLAEGLYTLSATLAIDSGSTDVADQWWEGDAQGLRVVAGRDSPPITIRMRLRPASPPSLSP